MQPLTTATARRRSVVAPLVLLGLLALGPSTLARLVSGVSSAVMWPVTRTFQSSGNAYEVANLELLLVYVIVVVGLNLFLQTGFFSLGHSVFFLLGAYTVGILTIKHHQPFWLAAAAAIVLAAAVGLLCSIPAARLGAFTFAMITLGYAIVASDLILDWDGLTGGGQGLLGLERPEPFNTLSRYYWLVAIVAALAYLVMRNTIRSPFGRGSKAVQSGSIAAASLGISPSIIRIRAYVISAIFAAIAGALFGPMLGLLGPTSFTVDLSVLFLLIVLLGGVGTVAGPILGAVLLFRIPLAMQDVTSRPGDVSLLAYGLVLVASIYVVPQGLMSGWWQLRSMVRRRVSAPASTERIASLKETLRPVTHEEGPLLVATDIRKAIGGVRALDGVSIRVDAGTVHALVGPNGSGKTTLLNIVSGYLNPDEGIVEFASRRLGRSSVDRRAAQGLGRTFQTPEVFDGMSCVENVMTALDMRHSRNLLWYMLALPHARAAERRTHKMAIQLLAAVGLVHRAGDNAGGLPPGERRRLEIARALGLQPRLLLMDEPAGGLTTSEIHQLEQTIRELRDAGIAILIVEHHTEMVWRLADKVTVLNFGRCISEGEPAVVRGDPEVLRAYLGEEATADRTQESQSARTGGYA